jgi:ribosomal-protein-alanine N-acetyltransferase
MRIETERLLLRHFLGSDLDAFLIYRNDEDWMRYQGFKGLTREAYRRVLLAPPDEDAGFQLAMVRKSDGRLAGDVYLRREGTTLWLGYTVSPALARRGYAREAAEGVARWAAINGFIRLAASVDPGNVASVSLLVKLGFVPAGRDEEGDDLYERPLCPAGAKGTTPSQSVESSCGTYSIASKDGASVPCDDR